MTHYIIQLKPIAEKQLASLPAKDAAKVAAKLDLLSSDATPIGSKKIQGHDGLWRVRFGSYRIIYAAPDDKKIIRILKIAPRGEAYRLI